MMTFGYLHAIYAEFLRYMYIYHVDVHRVLTITCTITSYLSSPPLNFSFEIDEEKEVTNHYLVHFHSLSQLQGVIIASIPIDIIDYGQS